MITLANHPAQVNYVNSAVANQQAHINAQNTIVSQNLLDDTQFYETLSSYRIFSLELIAVFCSIRVNFNNLK